MKEELSEKLVEIISSIQNSVGKASDFAVAQLPDIAQQYLSFGRWYETISFVALIALTAVLVVTACWCLGKKKDAGYDDDIGYILGAIASIIVAFITGLFVLASIQGLLLVWLAPKIYLIKGLAALIK